MLVWLKQKIHASQIDSFICAELPDPTVDKELFEVIKSHTIRGPCGAMNPGSPRMQEGKCTKKYPRGFAQDADTGEDGYPQYRRRKPEDCRISFNMKVRRHDEVDNRWVVPYCPLLSKIFKAHINVEFCNSVKSIKYICKYVHKGSDMAVFGTNINRN